jgi:hypothetical protein
MIRKLAQELAGLDVNHASVTGKNNIRPDLGPSLTPRPKPMEEPFTQLVTERAQDTRQGELGRTFGEFAGSVGDFRNTIGKLLDTKIEEISGSTAAAQAVSRNRRTG